MVNETIAIYRPYRYGPQTIGTYNYNDSTFYINGKQLLYVPNINAQTNIVSIKTLTATELIQIEKLFTREGALLIAAINDRRFLVRFRKKVALYGIDIEGNLNNLMGEDANDWNLFENYILVGTIISILRYEYIHQPPTIVAYNTDTNKYYVNNFIEVHLDVKGEPQPVKNIMELYGLYYKMIVNESNIIIKTNRGYQCF